MQLYEHQKRFAIKNPRKALLCWEVRTGKTVAAAVWLNLRQNKKALVICPKSIVEKWKRDLKTWKAKADVISRDTVHKTDLHRYRAVIVDEVHDFASPLFTGKASRRAAALYQFVRAHPEADILLLSGTPIRSTPWNIHTLACFLGIYWDKAAFQNEFFVLVRRFGRMFYEEKSDWRIRVRPYLEQIADIVLMKDCYDMPHPKDPIVVEVKQVASSATSWHERHKAEQSNKKIDALRRVLDGYRKVMLVCYYREQIERYEKEFADREVFVLHGGVKNHDAVIQAARAADDCIFIVQSSMGVGFDAWEFSAMVFASLDFKYVAYEQMLGRMKQMGATVAKDVVVVLGGECDTAVWEQIQRGRDFTPSQYLAGTSRTAAQK